MTETLSITPRFCANCGTPIPSASNFCPSCGKEVVRSQRLSEIADDPAAVATPLRNEAWVRSAPDAPSHAAATAVTPVPPSPLRFWLVGVPITLVVLGLLAWAVLKGLPFGGRERSEKRPAREVAKVSEGSASTTTVSEIASGADGSDGTTTAPAPSIIEIKPNAPPPSQRKPSIPEPLEVTEPEEAERTAPPPLQREGGEMSEGTALDRLDSFLAARDPYGIPPDCYATRSRGYRNRGYTIDVVSRSCTQNPSRPELLGRWRIDTVTGEIFRQNQAGRYVRP